MPDLEVGGLDPNDAPDDIGVSEPGEEKLDMGADEKALLELDESSWDTDTSKPPDQGDEPKDDKAEDDEPVEGEAKPEGEAEPKEDQALLEAKAEYNEAFGKWKMLMEAAGVNLKGETPSEMLQEFEDAILDARVKEQQGGQSQDEKSPAGTRPALDEVFEKHSEALEFSPALKEFYTDIVGTIAGAATEVMNEQLQQFQTQMQLTQARSWYSEAKAQAGDESFPSFREAFSMLQLNPEFVQRAKDRFQVFKDVDYNPVAKAAEKWRATKSPDGLTKGEKAKRDTEALKVKRLRDTGKPTRIPAAGQKPSEQLVTMAEEMDNIPWEKF